jgi:SAM-dependent methyltransferase
VPHLVSPSTPVEAPGMTPTRVTAEPVCWNTVGHAWQTGHDCVWREHSDAVNIALCRRWLPPTAGGRLLKTDLFDEATGDGLIDALQDRARRVMGLDYALSVAAGARARRRAADVMVADVRRLPFADHSFDAVVSNSTLDHFAHASDIGLSLGNLRRILVPGGRLVLTLDNGSHPLVALRNALPIGLLMRAGLVPYYVGQTLRPAPLAALLEHSGFRVVEMTAILHCPRVLVVPLARLASRRGPSSAAARWLLRLTRLCEHAERLPSRFYTGHFVAVLAQRL